jgi:hypothetical protein
MSFKKLSFIALLGALSSSFNAVAWGPNGHRIIGKVAEEHLTTATSQALSPLLDESSLAQVSTWADEMRSNDSNFWRKQSTKWHYINVKDATKMHHHINHSINSKEHVKNILDGIYYCINTLKSDSKSIDEKRFALRFLVHLVGDSHQPFHAGRSEDQGGNLIKVTFFGDQTNLHSTWDTNLIENERLSYSEFAEFIKTSNEKTINDYLNSEPADWLLESHHISDEIYNLNETEISYGYVYKYMPIVKLRLQQGGIRLAGLLNQIFDKNAAPLKEALKTSNIVAAK